MNRSPLFCLVVFISLISNIHSQVPIHDSGGPLMPEQAAYDVTYYDLTLQIFPNQRAIDGKLQMDAKIVQPVDHIVMDLDTTFEISAISEWVNGGQIARPFERKIGKIWIDMTRTLQPGQRFTVEVAYNGQPREAPNPPWDGGFTWDKTADGSHWIATSCQKQGADLWWPNKDHVSDEPDSVGLHIRVPQPLIVASNGRLRNQEVYSDGTQTFHWHVSTSINNYNVALNIAPYEVIEGEMKSIAGDIFPVYFWVLPEDLENGQKLFPQILDHLRFYEETLGPYPFRADKYGVAQTPHLGMEHQTIIAYGADFENSSMTGVDWGYDDLHHHELGHEWWGNLVTCTDWRDAWIHEGFCTYMQGLYVEENEGWEGLKRFMARSRFFSNALPIAPRETKSSVDAWKAPIYPKGAWILHSLRAVVGDSAFFEILRRTTYPDPDMESVTDGSHTRFITTNEFKHTAEAISGEDLDWFFEVYVRQPELPKLNAERNGNQLTLSWDVPENLDFQMPLEIQIGDEKQQVLVPKEGVSMTVDAEKSLSIDPDYRVLFEADKNLNLKGKSKN